MRNTLIIVAVLALIGGGVAVAASTGSDDVLRDPNRADCPGLIECPLTGELICADQCPLNQEHSADTDGSVSAGPRPCCRDK